MASGDVLFVAEDSDISPYETVGDVSPAVDVCAFHDDAILYLCFVYNDVVANCLYVCGLVGGRGVFHHHRFG